MKEPRRLLGDDTTSELARSVLVAGRERRAPEGARERVWGTLAVGLAGGAAKASAAGTAAAGAGAGAAGGSISAKAGGTALALTKIKLLVVGAILATGVGVTVAALTKDETPSAAVSAPAGTAPAENGTKQEVRAAPSPPSSAAVAEAPPEPTATPDATPQTGASTKANGKAEATAKPVAMLRARTDTRTSPEPDQATPASRPDNVPPVVEQAPAPLDASKLREQAALLHEVRAALARGDVVGARSTLEDAHRRFPKSELAQERDALEVRLAIESGDRTRAVALARAFVEHHPDSPLRPGIEAVIRAPEQR